MSKITDQIQELTELGRQIIDHGKREYGRGWNNIDNRIKVYWADNSNHTAFDIDGFEIGYYTTEPGYSMRLSHLNKMDEMLSYAEKVLAELARAYKNLEADEKEQLKRERIEALKDELSELESTDEQ